MLALRSAVQLIGSCCFYLYNMKFVSISGFLYVKRSGNVFFDVNTIFNFSKPAPFSSSKACLMQVVIADKLDDLILTKLGISYPQENTETIPTLLVWYELSNIGSNVGAERGVVDHHSVNVSDTVSVAGRVIGVVRCSPLLPYWNQTG